MKCLSPLLSRASLCRPYWFIPWSHATTGHPFHESHENDCALVLIQKGAVRERHQAPELGEPQEQGIQTVAGASDKQRQQKSPQQGTERVRHGAIPTVPTLTPPNEVGILDRVWAVKGSDVVSFGFGDSSSILDPSFHF